MKHISDRKASSNIASIPVKPPILEKLEPQILLSGDGLLYATAPDPLLNSIHVVDQYAELLETDDQVEQELSQELTSSDMVGIDLYQPIFTLSLSDEATDMNLNLDDTCTSQTDIELTILDDSMEDEDVDSKIIATAIIDVEEPVTNNTTILTEDGSMQIYNTDADLSMTCPLI
jgi:hypothetical protein